MEINKQLFEDVLSGKLKGLFVLRANNTKVNSDMLERNNSFYSGTHPYRLFSATYNPNGKTSLYDYEGLNDIIDFIPDTNMKENELTIEIPNNKVVDWDESKKQNKIVLKDKQLTYEDVCKKLFKSDVYYIADNGNVKMGYIGFGHVTDSNNASTKHQLECILAKNKLANIALYLNNGWKPDADYKGHFDAWFLYLTSDKNYIGYGKINNCCENNNVLFKSFELAHQAIEILGEETVKLALEPLGV